jgi:hypothetical protein
MIYCYENGTVNGETYYRTILDFSGKSYIFPAHKTAKEARTIPVRAHKTVLAVALCKFACTFPPATPTGHGPMATRPHMTQSHRDTAHSPTWPHPPAVQHEVTNTVEAK